MKYDFVNELGYAALATRLKRISEVMVHSGRQMYKELGVDIEPNWFLIFKLLTKFEQQSVTEMASKLHFSHPSIISLVGKMEENGYLISKPDKDDARKKQYFLSAKAVDKIPEYEKIWDAATLSQRKIFEDDSFLNQLEQIEIKLSQSDFRTRTLKELENE